MKTSKLTVQNMKMSRRLLLACGLLCLSGCGWHLRGRAQIPIDTLYIDLGENSAMGATLRRNIEALTNVKVVNDFRVVLQSGTELLPTTTVTSTRELYWDESDYNGMGSQMRLLFEEMEQNCIRQMVTRLAHISPEVIEKRRNDLE